MAKSGTGLKQLCRVLSLNVCRGCQSGSWLKYTVAVKESLFTIPCSGIQNRVQKTQVLPPNLVDCRASLCSRKGQCIEKYCKDSAEHKDWVEQWTVSPQDGSVSTGWTVSPQGGLCLHKVDGSPQGWLCPRKVDCAYTRLTGLHKVDCVSTRLTVLTVPPQGGLCLHKVDLVSTRWTVSPQGGRVSTRWTVSTQGGQVSTRLTVQNIKTKESRGPCLHKVDVSPQGGRFSKMWTVSTRGWLCLHRAETPFSAAGIQIGCKNSGFLPPNCSQPNLAYF